jgi:hypothetical protein
VIAIASVSEQVFEERLDDCALLVLRSTTGPFSSVERAFAVLICVDCLAARGHGTGPYPAMTRAELRASLDLLATWVLETRQL